MPGHILWQMVWLQVVTPLLGILNSWLLHFEIQNSGKLYTCQPTSHSCMFDHDWWHKSRPWRLKSRWRPHGRQHPWQQNCWRVSRSWIEAGRTWPFPWFSGSYMLFCWICKKSITVQVWTKCSVGLSDQELLEFECNTLVIPPALRFETRLQVSKCFFQTCGVSDAGRGRWAFPPDSDSIGAAFLRSLAEVGRMMALWCQCYIVRWGTIFQPCIFKYVSYPSEI